MNRTSRTSSRASWLVRSFVGLTALSSVLFGSLGLAAVTVDQTPLTVQATLSPNIVLMLDDSGSMAWNFMPDICYVPGVANLTFCTSVGGDLKAQPNSATNMALINSANNGVYYNPTVTYTAPVTAASTTTAEVHYANSPGLTGAYVDGFLNTATTVNITTYAPLSSCSTGTTGSGNQYTCTGAYETYDNGGGAGTGRSNVPYSIAATLKTLTGTTQTPTCNTGYSLQGAGSARACVASTAPTCSTGTYQPSSGTCLVTAGTPSCPTPYTQSGSGAGLTCKATATPTCSNGTYDSSTGTCTPPTVTPVCPSGYTQSGSGASFACTKTATPLCANSTAYSPSTGTCTLTATPQCPSGSTSNGLGGSSFACIVTPSCANSTSYDSSSHLCTLTATPQCPSGSTSNGLAGSSFACIVTPSCGNSTSYDSTTHLCTTTATPQCPSGSSPNGSGASFSCRVTPSCANNTTYDSTTHLCTTGGVTPVCPDSGYTLQGSGSTWACVLTATPNCSGTNHWDTTSARCENSSGNASGTRSCNSGFSYNSPINTLNLCEKSGATATCAKGTYSSSSGACVAPSPTCPATPANSATGSGATLVCTATGTITCAQGTYSSGACVAPSPACPATPTNTATGSGATLVCKATGITCAQGTYSTGACVPPAPACPATPASTATGSGATLVCSATAITCAQGTYGNGVCAAPAPTCPNTYQMSGSGASLVCTASTTPTCSQGTYNAGTCTITPVSPACPSGYTVAGSGSSLNCVSTVTPQCSSGTYDPTSGVCLGVAPAAGCPSGGSIALYGSTYQCVQATPNCASGYSYIVSTGLCASSTTTDGTFNFFRYAYGTSAYYVASTAQGCSTQPNCYLETDTNGFAAPAGVAAGQNIANWFSYYRTRMLLAKSGLMNGFTALDPGVRVGFGSINDGGSGNNNDVNLPGTPVTYNSTKIAQVKKFDNGASGTQKAAFWTWVNSVTPGGGTPLRTALDAVGQYYGTSAPWLTGGTGSDASTEYACRQSYTILTTDGFWNDSYSSSGNADNIAGTAVTGPNAQTFTYSPASPYSGSTSNTLADVAMKYWETDLRSTVLNEVPTSAEDSAFWQHMTTFTLGLGFQPVYTNGTTIPVDDIFTWALGGSPVASFTANSGWPAPASNSLNNIADLAHAAVNGHGGFYSATSPQAFSAGIKDAVTRVQTRVGSGASLAANSTKLNTGTTVYQALYFTGKWTGDIKAFPVNSTSGAIASSPAWTASAVLPTAANRTIKTYNPTTNAMVDFTIPGNLSTAQATALGSTAVTQQNMINYLRGDPSNEQSKNGTFRTRDSAIGDVIDSQPVYIGAPDPNAFYGKSFSGSGSYSSFASSKLTRTPLVWVAANDGMLHAFQGSNGVEVFAYLPSAVITPFTVVTDATTSPATTVTSSISALSNPNYGAPSVPHMLFNDGQLTVADVYMSGSWKTVLVGTTGRGGPKAIYALDVTDPTAPTLLWERSAGDGLTNSGYIGQIASQPVIAQVADGTWAVLMGNGYNSANNTAALLQFAMSDGTLTVHTAGGATNNGLSAPAVWIGNLNNDISTVAYAGDLNGKVWSFQLNNGTSATPSSAGTVMFTAVDSLSNTQPITGGMLAGKNPATNDVWLFFGTGRYLTANDLASRATQTWYGIIVQSNTASLVSNLASWSGSRTASSANALVPRSILAEQAPTTTSLGGRVVTTPVASDMVGKSGWFMDLLQPPSSTAQGERMVTPNQFQGSLLLGTTRIPISSDVCNPSGSGWIMALDPFTGGNPAAPFFDLNGDSQFNALDKITVNGVDYASAGVGFSAVPNNPIFVGNTMLTSFDNATTSSIATAGTVGALSRQSWREIFTH